MLARGSPPLLVPPPGRPRRRRRTREGVGGLDPARLLGRRGPPARADPRRSQGRPAAAPARDANATRADLPALRRRARCSSGPVASLRGTSSKAGCGRGSGPSKAEELELGTPLLIADGHHRYVTVVAYRQEHPEATHTFADPGFLSRARSGDLPDASPRPAGRGRARRAGRRAGRRRDAAPRRHVHAGRDRRRFRPTDRGVVRTSGCPYTPYADEAIAAVDRGEAARVAFLLQPVTVEQVARFAQAGETMPQKSTFFYPKLTSGLLFHPVPSP